MHDVRERYVLGADGDAGLGRGDPDRRLDDRLPVGQLARRGFVRTVPVARVGSLPQQDASVPHQQEDDIHDDPAAMLNLCSHRGVAGSAHSDRLAARPKTPTPTWAPARRLSVLYALPRNKHGTSAGLWIAMCTRPANLWTRRGKRSTSCGYDHRLALAGRQPGLWRTGRPCGRGTPRIAEKPPTVAFPSVTHRNRRRRTKGLKDLRKGSEPPSGRRPRRPGRGAASSPR